MKMKSLLAALALSTAMTMPVLAQAKTVTLATTLTQYGGQGAYLAIYVTDPSGAYAGSVWMAGGKTKYYKHLTDWARFTGGDPAEVQGITGASVGAGRSLQLSMDLSDALFDAGYTLHIDASAEEMRDSPNEIAVPLTRAGAGTPIQGRRYIDAFRYDF
jgi:membrane-associated PAP2 superfamily phosphatase